MKRLANLKNDLPSNSKLNKFQSLKLRGGADKRKGQGGTNVVGNNDPCETGNSGG